MKSLLRIGIYFLFGISILSASSLYSDKDPLWELESSNFENIVIGKNKAWIIQFYNSWCGHCIRFSPLWKLFGHDTKMWRKVIDIGVVNCNDAENVKLCRQYDVQSYPTIKLFWHNVDHKDMGKDLEGNRDIPSMERTVIEYLESNWDKGVPSDWPDLSVLKSSSISQILKSNVVKDEGLYLFIEDEESLVGRQAILDLSFQNNAVIRRVLNTNTDLMNDLGPTMYNGSVPIVININPQGNAHVYLRFAHNATSLDIRDELFESIVGHTRMDYNIFQNNATKEGENSLILTDSVYMVDIENALYSLLNREVGVAKVIDGDKLSTLKAFLSVLKSYFPGSPPVISYLSNLYNWVSYKKRSVTGEEFVQTMDQLKNEKEYIPEMRDWMGCRGSESKYRGYPCSLWTLFHTLTVQADKEFEESEGNSESAVQALFIIRDYIKHFFSCHECSEHFGEMAVNIEKEVNSSQNAVLWLWNAHNNVNERLAGDATEDPKHPKVQFPLPKLCPNCRISGNSFDDTVWDNSNVIEFLHKFYGKQNIRRIDTLKVGDSVSADQTLNNSAMGLKLILTPVCATIVMLFYFVNRYY